MAAILIYASIACVEKLVSFDMNCPCYIKVEAVLVIAWIVVIKTNKST
jgi:hypothetical protein